MRIPWGRREPRSVLSGPVCTVRIIVNIDFEADDSDYSALQVLAGETHKEGRLHSQMLAATHQVLGPEFDLRSMSVARGSIEILVTIGAVYYAVSRYKNFIESIELLASQLAGVARRFLESLLRNSSRPIRQIAVAATWEPGPGLIRLEAEDLAPTASAWAYPLLWYVIVSHAALLALFIWLLSRR